MKATLIIDDKKIDEKLNELIGQRIAALTDEKLDKLVTDVITKKVERSCADKNLVRREIRVMLEEVMGDHTHSFNNKWLSMVREEIKSIALEQVTLLRK